MILYSICTTEVEPKHSFNKEMPVPDFNFVKLFLFPELVMTVLSLMVYFIAWWELHTFALSILLPVLQWES